MRRHGRGSGKGSGLSRDSDEDDQPHPRGSYSSGSNLTGYPDRSNYRSEDTRKSYKSRHDSKQKRKWLPWLVIILLTAILLGSILGATKLWQEQQEIQKQHWSQEQQWLQYQMKSFPTITSSKQVVQIVVSSTHVPDEMDVQVILFENGKEVSHTFYRLKGTAWRLLGYTISSKDRNKLDISPVYRITDLQISDGVDVPTAHRNTIALNDRNENLLKRIQDSPEYSSLISITPISSDFVKASKDKKTYDVFVTQTGLILVRTN